MTRTPLPHSTAPTTLAALTLAVALAVPTLAVAQTPAAAVAAEEQRAGVGDAAQADPAGMAQANQASAEMFLKRAGDLHAYSIEAADLVLGSDADGPAKALARDLKQAHENALENLNAAAEAAGMSVQGGIQAPIVSQKLANLKQANGTPEFAQSYVFESFGGAAEATLWFARAARMNLDPELRTYARNTTAVLREQGRLSRESAAELIGTDVLASGGDPAEADAAGRDARGLPGDPSDDDVGIRDTTDGTDDARLAPAAGLGVDRGAIIDDDEADEAGPDELPGSGNNLNTAEDGD